MEKNYIYSGKYKNWHFSLKLNGKVELVEPWGIKRIPMDKTNVSSVCPLGAEETKKGGIGRALVGGAIAGPVGALVGASTAKTKVTSYSICLTMNDGTSITCEVDKYIFMALMNM